MKDFINMIEEWACEDELGEWVAALLLLAAGITGTLIGAGIQALVS